MSMEYAVTVRITPDDFEHLTAQSTALRHPGDISGFADRFYDHACGEFAAPLDLERWRYAYWIDGYADLILARSFLAAAGVPFLVTSDEYVEEAETVHGTIHHVHGADWVIFTDYASPAWAGNSGEEDQR